MFGHNRIASTDARPSLIAVEQGVAKIVLGRHDHILELLVARESEYEAMQRGQVGGKCGADMDVVVHRRVQSTSFLASPT